MLYRILRAINEAYALTMLWVYIVLFVVAMSMMFIFPPVTLALLFFSVFGLGAVIVLAKMLGAIQRMIARRAVDRGVCPRCAGELTGRPAVDDAPGLRCERCRTTYLHSGAEAAEAPAFNSMG